MHHPKYSIRNNADNAVQSRAELTYTAERSVAFVLVVCADQATCAGKRECRCETRADRPSASHGIAAEAHGYDGQEQGKIGSHVVEFCHSSDGYVMVSKL